MKSKVFFPNLRDTKIAMYLCDFPQNLQLNANFNGLHKWDNCNYMYASVLNYHF